MHNSCATTWSTSLIGAWTSRQLSRTMAVSGEVFTFVNDVSDGNNFLDKKRTLRQC